MKSFGAFISEMAGVMDPGVQTRNIRGVVDPGATGAYVPKQSMVPTPGVQTTGWGLEGDRLVGGGDGREDMFAHSSPEIAGHLQRLNAIHKEMREIFARLKRSKYFRTSGQGNFEEPFERELLAGIDGVGRAVAILAPDPTRPDPWG